MKPAIKAEIERRTPKAWYGLASPSGWDELVEETFKKLLNLYPDLEIHQIKEKFGGLRFYCNIPYDNKELAEKLYAIVKDAEDRSWGICQACGSEEDVELSGSGWVATLCGKCEEHNLSVGKSTGYNDGY